MHRGIHLILTLPLLAVAGPQPSYAASEAAVAKMKLVDGTGAGSISLSETNAGILIKFELQGLTPGPHAIHVHETGKCEADFASAGAIHNPLGAGHGFLNSEGPMSGDLPNIHASADGKANGELLSNFLSLSRDSEDSIFDSDGSSLVIFEKPDDHLNRSGRRSWCAYRLRRA